MRDLLALAVVVGLFSLSAAGGTAARQARPANASAMSIDEVLQAVRGDLQSTRADVLAKNLTLTSEQAAAFGPMYEAYQQEQNVIMDDQMRGIQRYVQNFDSLDDAGALALIEAHFDRDTRMNALRQKWLADFQQVLGTKLAVRAMQIDRRLSLSHQVQFAAQIPLAR